MQGVLLAMFAILAALQFASHVFLVDVGHVVAVVAFGARQPDLVGHEGTSFQLKVGAKSKAPTP